MLPYVCLSYDDFGGGKKEGGPKEKPCLKCGKLKVHNNDFCSAKCCKDYRRKN